MQLTEIHQLALAAGLGFLVGLQREVAHPQIAGARTFTLIALFGALLGIVSNQLEGGIVVAGLLAITALLAVANWIKAQAGEPDPGMTTEIAVLVVFLVGVLLARGHLAAALVSAGGAAVLLQWKEPVHAFAERLRPSELRAGTRLVLIALVILPVLPNRTFGPYDVLNPFEIWWMVVLIVGISLVAYLAHHLLSQRVGTVLAGVLGGLISSTATTVGYSRRARETPTLTPLAAVVLIIASSVVFVRVLIEIAIVAPATLTTTAPPLVAMAAWMAVVSYGALLRLPRRAHVADDHDPPTDLRAAIVFGLLYAAVLFAVAAAREHFGDRGLYAVAVLSGLTDMDAITLSTAQLMASERIDHDLGWRLILVGALSNLVFKGGVVAVLGPRRLLARMALLFGLTLAGGLALLLWWPVG
ncbi:MAG: MgtC/SapB family protein [Acidobacteriota bacterium]